jgi:hypothetical protein
MLQFCITVIDNADSIEYNVFLYKSVLYDGGPWANRLWPGIGFWLCRILAALISF